jgi:hypothetical protein
MLEISSDPSPRIFLLTVALAAGCGVDGASSGDDGTGTTTTMMTTSVTPTTGGASTTSDTTGGASATSDTTGGASTTSDTTTTTGATSDTTASSTSGTSTDAAMSTSSGSDTESTGTSGSGGTETDTGTGTTGEAEPLARCFVTHDGGTPASSTVIRVAEDGSLADLGATSLIGSHTPAMFERRGEAITRCGDRIYYALGTEIGTALFSADGSLAGATTFEQSAPIDAVFCAGDDTLLTFGRAGGSTVTVRRHALDGDGTPSLGFEGDVTFKYPEMRQLHGTLHPTLPLLYVVAATMEFPDEAAQEAVIVSYETPMTLSFGSLIDVGSNFHYGVLVNVTGDILHLVGYSGGCTAYHDLPPDGAIPPLAALTFYCNGPWENNVSAALRSEGNIFYQKPTSAVVHVGEWSNGLVDHGSTDAANPGLALLALTHDDTVLIEGGQDGVIATHTISDDGLTLTAADTVDIASTAFFQAGLVVPCD